MTSPTFVSLLDVIGYRKKIDDDRLSGEERFKKNLVRALSVFNELNEAEFGYQAISDTIIVSTPPSAPFCDLLRALKKIHRSFLENGLFIRGGVAFAAHFRSGNLTYSHALPVAYALEQQQAVYPRIVIDNNIIELFSGEGKLCSEIAEVAAEKLICVQNGVYFVNTVYGAEAEYYRLARDIYANESPFLQGREHELAKHRWLQDYILNSSEGGDLTPYIEPISLFSPHATTG